MRISYNKLWKMLIDKNMKKSDLKEKAGICSASLAKLGKGDNITTDVRMERSYGFRRLTRRSGSYDEQIEKLDRVV